MQRFAAFDIDKTHYTGVLAHDFIAELIDRDVIPNNLVEVDTYHQDPSDENLIKALQAGQASDTMPFTEYVDCGIAVGARAAGNTNPEVSELFRDAWKKLGMTTIAISTSPFAVVKPFCDNVGPYEFVFAPMAQNIDGFVGPRSIIRSSERDKGEWLKRVVDLLGLTFEGSIAIGDSASDIAMLELVERPIAYRPDDTLKQAAEIKKWEVWQ